MELLESARKFYLKFVAERKDDPAARRGLGYAYLRLGALAETVDRDIPRAKEYFTRAKAVFAALLAEAPDDPRRMADLAWSWKDDATAEWEAGRFAEGDAALDRAITLQ